MKIGANNKRNVYILSALAVVGAYVLWTNVFSSSGNEDASKVASNHTPANLPPTAIAHTAPANVDVAQRRKEGQSRSADFSPIYKTGAIIDPVKVDPTLRLDILSKVQTVVIEADAQRNLFQYGAAQKPVDTTPIPNPKPIKLGPQPVVGPTLPPGPPADPVAPPITLKYYGFANPRTSGHKRAFFLDNDDIIVAAEGELIKRRYKLVKIGVNFVTMEDTQFKTQQTLPLAPDATT